MNIIISEPTFLFFNFVKDFQSLIAGIIGFFGVVVTLIVNGYLLRKQEMSIVNQKRISISSAIATELKQIADSLTDTSKAAENIPDTTFPTFFAFDCTYVFETYDALIGDIGFLEQHVANKIVQSRYLIRSFIHKMKGLETRDIYICQTREFYDNQNSKILKFQDPRVIKEVAKLINGYSEKLREDSDFIFAQIKRM